LVLSFSAVSNKTYSVLYQEIATTNWTKMADVPGMPVSQFVFVTNAPTANTQFYRVATPALT